MNTQQHYQESLDYIYQYVKNSQTHQKDQSLQIQDLSRMYSLMEVLGNPHRIFPSIHIAGSKGKGSVSVFCATVLACEGYKVGLYTSPHIRDFEERIQINRVPIPRKDLVAYVDELKPYIDMIPGVTTFEIATALAFLYFMREKVDIAVIEVGLGGRLDATNVISPIASVITPIYLEHTQILGSTLHQIATEKGGIIKEGIPVIISPQVDEALRSIVEIASKRRAPLIQVGEDYTYERKGSTREMQTFTIYHEISGEISTLSIKLLGQHQIENAATAYTTLQVIKEQGIQLSGEAITEGFLNTEWPARFEILNDHPPVVVDSAHNPDSARRVRDTIREYFPNRSIVLVIGVSEEKNINGIIDELLPDVQNIICTQSTHPRAVDADSLFKSLSHLNTPISEAVPIEKALREAMEIAGSDALVFITGSIFVAASARIAWFETIKRDIGF